MPRSRAPSPSEKESSPQDGESTSTQTISYVCPSVHHHPGLRIPNPNAPMHMHSDGSATGSGGVKKKFKYVKPRLGGNFQAKIAPFQPKKLKEDQDLDDLNQSGHGSSTAIAVSAATTTGGGKRKRAGRPPKGARTKQLESTELLTYDPALKSKRGGLCIHRPPVTTSEESISTFMTGTRPQHLSYDRYLTYCRNLTLQTPKEKKHSINRADHLWKAALEQDTYKVLDQVLVPEKKRGRKRKLAKSLEKSESGVSIATTSIDVSSLGSGMNGGMVGLDSRGASPCPYSVDAQHVDGDIDVRCGVRCGVDGNGHADNRTAKSALGMESDDRMLEYLQLDALGKTKRAQFLMLVDLCRGTAVKTRKRIRKAKKKEEENGGVPLSALLAPHSDSWIRRYERIGTTIKGDHRRNFGQTNKYPYYDHGDSSSSPVYPWSRNWDSDKSGNECCDKSKMKSNVTMTKQAIDESWDDFEKIKGDEELINAWVCILQKGQIILENYKKGHKPMFADLFTLLKKAHSMPKPEDIFQKRDTMPKQVSQCLNSILDLVGNGRMVMAHLVDSLYDGANDGIELQTLRKTLDSKSAICNVQLEEISIVHEIMNESLGWESRLSASSEVESSSSEDLHLPQQSLTSAEELANDGRKLSLRPTSLVLLESRICRAYELRNRIRLWSKNNGNEKDSVKYIGSMIKEANKINLSFHELSLLSKVHRDAEEWMDRANVALRSKISLKELETLVKTGEKMPLGLTGSLEKLQSRYNQVCDWVTALKVEVPCPLESVSESGCNLDAGNRAEWLSKIRETLKSGADDSVSALIEISSQGSRLPVEIDLLHLLQTAIDARNWSQKARRWVPSAGDQFKRGKIEDLQYHLDSADVILKKAQQLTDGKADWELDFSDELQSIVKRAEDWFDKYHSYLTGDNRRANNRNSISYIKLRTIVKEAEGIPTNLGNLFSKINRIHNEAGSWMEANRILLQRCGVDFGEKVDTSLMKPVLIDEVNNAIENAAKELSVDLVEIKTLKDMAEQSQGWFDQALEFAPKRNKRIVGSKKDRIEKCTMDKVVALIESASGIPMDTSEDVSRLQLLLSDVQSWRLDSQTKIKDIASTIRILIQERCQFYGEPSQFLEACPSEPMELATSDRTTENNTSSNVNAKGASAPESVGLSTLTPEKSGNDVYKMTENLNKSADSLHILTLEEEIVKRLYIIMKWCKKVAVIIDSYENVFTDKRWKKDLEVLISDGNSCKTSVSDNNFSIPIPSDGSEEKAILELVASSVKDLISGDLVRLTKLQHQQDAYYAWCKKATEEYIESDKRIPYEKLLSLATECSIYPPNAETVKRITKDSKVAVAWVADVKTLLDAGNKISLEQVKNKLSKVSRVKITSPEYRSLRKAHQNAKNWTTRVKKSGLRDGSAQIHVLKQLLREYDDLIIAVPDELEELKQTLCGYCICRRPYEGFMIGCDDCDEWYHGPCIGMTQAQSERIEKFVCVRCCVKRVYKISSDKIAKIVRKWCDHKDLSKARSQDNQKHQRKIREKKREIVKWNEECKASVEKLQRVKAQKLESLNTYQACNGQLSTSDENNEPSLDSVINDNLKAAEALATANITKATTALEQANLKMMEFKRISDERKANHNREDQLSPCFRYWAAMIREKVLAPETDELAKASLPMPTIKTENSTQLMSEPMKEVLLATSELGIADYPDIRVVRNAFQCIGWCCLAFDVLMKKPTIDELSCLLKLNELIKLPEVKSVGMIRSMKARTSLWRAKVRKVLTPIANETKPFNTAMLKELGVGMSAIPVVTPEEEMLCNAISDEGERHCVCGGPRDEKLMTFCVSCKKWYHQKCLNSVDETQSENWKCCFCKNGTVSIQKKINPPSLCWPFLGSTEGDISAHAPIAKELWPPFGLATSTEAVNALGFALTIKVENLRKPKPKTLESTEDIVKKAISATNQERIAPALTPMMSAQMQPKIIQQISLKKTVGSTPIAQPSTSILTKHFPSLVKVPNTTNKSTSINVAGTLLQGNGRPLLPGQNQLSKKTPLAHGTNAQINGVAHPNNLKQKSVVLSVTTNGKTISAPVAVTKLGNENLCSTITPFVEGLAPSDVQEALLVARQIAESTPITSAIAPACATVVKSASLLNAEKWKSLHQNQNSNLTQRAPSTKSFSAIAKAAVPNALVGATKHTKNGTINGGSQVPSVAAPPVLTYVSSNGTAAKKLDKDVVAAPNQPQNAVLPTYQGPPLGITIAKTPVTNNRNIPMVSAPKDQVSATLQTFKNVTALTEAPQQTATVGNWGTDVSKDSMKN